jgi:hypothetical protein
MFIIFVHISFKFLKELYDYFHKHPSCVYHLSDNEVSHITTEVLERSIKVLYTDDIQSKQEAEKFCEELFYTGFADYVKIQSIIKGAEDRIEMRSIIN